MRIITPEFAIELLSFQVKELPRKIIAQIKVQTNCLPYNTVIRQRLFHLINGNFDIPICPICNVKNLKWNYDRFLGTCSVKCSAKSLTRYEKTKNTKLSRYGTENYYNLDKARLTNLKNHGTEFYFQSAEFKNRFNSLCQERYGVDNPYQSEIIKTKIRETNLERYGTEIPTQSLDIVNKIIQTNLERYGSRSFTSRHISNDTHRLLTNLDWLHEMHINQGLLISQISTLLNVTPKTVSRYCEKFGIKIRQIANFSKISIDWLEYLMCENNIFIKHAQNGGEFRIPDTRIRVDGFCQETNTIYEFYGDVFHGNLDIFSPEQKIHPFRKELTALELNEKTKLRELSIVQLGFNLITIWESKWKNKQDVKT